MDNNNGFDFLSPRQLTYWPTDPRKNPDLIDFGITKNIDRGALSADISYDLCSDHLAIIVAYSWQTPISKALTNKMYYCGQKGECACEMKNLFNSCKSILSPSKESPLDEIHLYQRIFKSSKHAK